MLYFCMKSTLQKVATWIAMDLKDIFLVALFSFKIVYVTPKEFYILKKRD